MKTDAFAELLTSVRQAGRVRRGASPRGRVTKGMAGILMRMDNAVTSPALAPDRIAVVIPALNEALRIREVVEGARPWETGANDGGWIDTRGQTSGRPSL